MSAADEIHEVRCGCGQLRAILTGPLGDRVSICHCLACQRRTGSPFGEQIRLSADQVTIRPIRSIYEHRRHPWVMVPDTVVERSD